jgi:hypothetical protein
MNRARLLSFALILIILSSCAKPPEVKEPTVFFPSPPEPPRVQFLKSYRSSRDIEPPKSAFWSFITGGKDRTIVLDKPYGVAMYQGKIYVCDSNSTVIVLDLEKKTFSPLQGAQGLGKLQQPLNISIDKDGNKYVADPVRGQAVMFDKNDFYVKAFGPIEGWRPVDAVSYEGDLYVTDIKNGEVRVFDIATGSLKNSLGGGSNEATLGLPTNLAFDSEGYLYVSDAKRFQIVKLDRDGNFKGTVGRLGKVAGSFARPKGIAMDRKNRLYAVDAAFNNVQVFSPDGQLLIFFSKAGKGPGDLLLGAKVAIDYDDIKYFQQYADPNFQIEYLIIVTSQVGDRLVNVFGFGTEKGMTYTTDEELLKKVKDRADKELKEKKDKELKENQENEQKEKQEKELKDRQEHPEKTGDAELKKPADADVEQKKPEDAVQKKD